jgi:hypothetical protein
MTVVGLPTINHLKFFANCSCNGILDDCGAFANFTKQEEKEIRANETLSDTSCTIHQ